MIAIAAFLPWAHSGRATRSAFALARTADEIGVVRGPLARTLFIGLAFLPAAAAATWIAAVRGWLAGVATLGLVAGTLAVIGALAVWRAPVEAGVGPTVATLAGATAIVGAAGVALVWRKS